MPMRWRPTRQHGRDSTRSSRSRPADRDTSLEARALRRRVLRLGDLALMANADNTGLRL